jgi:ATP-binding cassette subfamily B protein
MSLHKSVEPQGALGSFAGPTGSFRSLLQNVRWALNMAWATNKGLTVTFVAIFLVQSFLPAVQALATRGLINTAVHQVRIHRAGLRPVLPWLLVALAAMLVEGLARVFQSFAYQRLEDDLNLELNTRMLRHTAELDVGFFENPESEDVLHRAKQNSARNLLRFLSEALSVVSKLVQILSLLAILVVIEPLILVLAPAVFPYARFQWRLSKIKHDLESSRATKRRWTQYFVSLLSDSSSIPEIKILDLAALLIAKFRALMMDFRDKDLVLLLRSRRAAGLFSVVGSVGLFSLFARVAARVIAGTSTLGDLAIFGAAAGRLRMTLEGEVGSLAGLREELLNVADLHELLTAKRSITAPPIPSQLPARLPGELDFECVSFTYPGSTGFSLRDVSLKIRAGETLALVGENGSGKTTLVKLLARFYDPSAGCVRIDGLDLRSIDPDVLRSRISFVFQTFGRYEATIADNIAYGDWRTLLEDREALERVAAKAGLEEILQSLPQGLDTVVGRKFGWRDLSHGQWQLIALARAFARPTSIIILDEPTSNLDPFAEYEIFSRFRALAEGRTAIVVSHRFSTVRVADRIAVMQRGTIVEVGSHDELMQKGAHYARLYNRATRLGGERVLFPVKTPAMKAVS